MSEYASAAHLPFMNICCDHLSLLGFFFSGFNQTFIKSTQSRIITLFSHLPNFFLSHISEEGEGEGERWKWRVWTFLNINVNVESIYTNERKTHFFKTTDATFFILSLSHLSYSVFPFFFFSYVAWWLRSFFFYI